MDFKKSEVQLMVKSSKQGVTNWKLLDDWLII